MKYTCLHGTSHSAEEFHAAINWAAKRHPTRDLVEGECWIALYQQHLKRKADGDENSNRMDRP